MSIQLSVICLRRRLNDPLMHAILQCIGRIWSADEMVSAALDHQARLSA